VPGAGVGRISYPCLSERNATETICWVKTVEGLTWTKVHGKMDHLGSPLTPGPIPQAFVKGHNRNATPGVTTILEIWKTRPLSFNKPFPGGRRADVASSYLFNNRDRHYYPILTIIVTDQKQPSWCLMTTNPVIGADFVWTFHFMSRR
jgi:hypothetical protein